MTINNRGLAGQPILPYTDFRSYAGADVFIDLTYLDHTMTECVPTAASYQLDDITNDINMIPSTALTLVNSVSFTITAANAAAQITSSGGNMNGYTLGTLNSGTAVGSILPVNNQINGVSLLGVGSCTSTLPANSFQIMLVGTYAQNFFTTLTFTDRLGNVETYTAASAAFNTTGFPGYSLWSWAPPTLLNPFTAGGQYTITLSGIASVTPQTPSAVLQIPGAKLVMTYPYQGSQLCQLTVTATVTDTVTGQPSQIRNVAILELCAIQTPFGS